MEGPDPQLVIAKKRQGIEQQQAQLSAQYVRIMEAVANIRQAKINIQASQEAIVRLKEELEQLESDHGQFTEANSLALADQIIHSASGGE